jgi:hypothetical protein
MEHALIPTGLQSIAIDVRMKNGATHIRTCLTCINLRWSSGFHKYINKLLKAYALHSRMRFPPIPTQPHFVRFILEFQVSVALCAPQRRAHRLVELW